jgi:hypothetical protein
MTMTATDDNEGKGRWRQWRTKARKIWWRTTNGKGVMVGRDAGDSGVAMIAGRVEDGGSRQWQQWDGRQQWWQTMTAVDDDGLHDWAADYGEGQEQAARDSRDSHPASRLPHIAHHPLILRCCLPSPLFVLSVTRFCLPCAVQHPPPPGIQYPLAHPNNCLI